MYNYVNFAAVARNAWNDPSLTDTIRSRH